MAQAGLGTRRPVMQYPRYPLATKGYHSRIIERGWEKDI